MKVDLMANGSGWSWIIASGLVGSLFALIFAVGGNLFSYPKQMGGSAANLREFESAKVSQYSRASDERQFLPFVHISEDRER